VEGAGCRELVASGGSIDGEKGRGRAPPPPPLASLAENTIITLESMCLAVKLISATVLGSIRADHSVLRVAIEVNILNLSLSLFVVYNRIFATVKRFSLSKTFFSRPYYIYCVFSVITYY
jgi:hypothetical protein